MADPQNPKDPKDVKTPNAPEKPAAPATGQAAPAAGTQPAINPEVEVNARISNLEIEVETLEKQIRVLEGRITNRNPEKVKGIKADAELNRTRIKNLQKALLLLMFDQLKPRSKEAATAQLEALRQSAIEYFTKLKIDTNLWKSIAS